MRKILTLLLAAVLTMVPFVCPAADISLEQDVFISSVRWYAGPAESENKISALHTGEQYATITALVEVAQYTTYRQPTLCWWERCWTAMGM